MIGALVAAALLAPAWTPGLQAANRYADGRPGTVAFAVRTDTNLWGRGLDTPMTGASVVKALLLVAYLRRADVRSRTLTRAERHLLGPMIRWSNNHDASKVAARLGARAVERTQRWGIGEVTPPGWTVYFKGGWGSGFWLVDHQVALLTRGQERVSVAVLTTTAGGHRAGKKTLRGVFARLLRGLTGASALGAGL